MSMVPSLVFFACMESATHSVHNHAADLQDRHVCFLALVSLPHDGAHPFQAWVGAVQPGKVTLQGNQTPLNTDTSPHGNYYYYYFRSPHPHYPPLYVLFHYVHKASLSLSLLCDSSIFDILSPIYPPSLLFASLSYNPV